MPTLLVVEALIGGRLLLLVCLSLEGSFLGVLDLDLDRVFVFLFFDDRDDRFLGDSLTEPSRLLSFLELLGEDLEYGLLRAPAPLRFFFSSCDSSL